MRRWQKAVYLYMGIGIAASMAWTAYQVFAKGQSRILLLWIALGAFLLKGAYDLLRNPTKTS